MREVRACTACGRLQADPAPVCRGCGGGSFATCALPFTGEIYSHTTVTRAPTAALQAETPYTAVLVRGRQGGLLLLRWNGAAPPAIGAAAIVDGRDGALVASAAPGTTP